MDEGEDWLLRPALRGLCRYTDLVGTELTLEDVAVMNEALDVEAENVWRADVAMRSARR